MVPFSFLGLLSVSLRSSVQGHREAEVRVTWPKGSWHSLPEGPGAGTWRGPQALGPLLGQGPARCFSAFRWQWGGGCGVPRGTDLGYAPVDKRGLSTPFRLGLASSVQDSGTDWPLSHTHPWA